MNALAKRTIVPRIWNVLFGLATATVQMQGQPQQPFVFLSDYNSQNIASPLAHFDGSSVTPADPMTFGTVFSTERSRHLFSCYAYSNQDLKVHTYVYALLGNYLTALEFDPGT